MAATKTLMTAEQLFHISGEGRSELVRGELVKMSPVGRVHGRLVMRLGKWLAIFVDDRQLGEIHTETGFIVARNPDTVRAPDICFIPTASLGEPDEDGFYEGAPALAVEVLSPENRPKQVREKIAEYFGGGTREVWVVDPERETIIIHLPSREARTYEGAEEVSSTALPGFSFRPLDLFAPTSRRTS